MNILRFYIIFVLSHQTTLGLFTAPHHKAIKAQPRVSRRSGMYMLNRILVRENEITKIPPGVCATIPAAPQRNVVFPFSDPRAKHCATILRSRDGDEVKLGVINVGIIDDAVVRWIWPAGYEDGKKERGQCAEAPCRERTRPGKRNRLNRVDPTALELTFELDTIRHVEKPRVDLLLALPRPLQLQRMLPMISQLGVGTLIVTNAFKVEADYWGSHLLRSTEAVEELCIEGLAQSGDVHLPRVVFAKRLKAFLEDDLDALLPPELSQRVVAHPYPLKGRTTLNSGRVSELPPPSAVHGPGELPRILVAVGPEGGWDGNGHELGMLSAKGFGSVSLGPRILRSDVAVNSLLALAQEQIRSWDTADDP